MGNTDSKVDFRGAVVQLTSRSQVIPLISSLLFIFLLVDSKSNQMMNRFGINFGRIKSPVSRISSHSFPLQKFVHYAKNYHRTSQYSATNSSNDYNLLLNIPVKLNAIKQQVNILYDLSQTRHFLFTAINCVRLLTRILPYIFEEPEWRGFFWSDVPTSQQAITTNDVREDRCCIRRIFDDFFFIGACE